MHPPARSFPSSLGPVPLALAAALAATIPTGAAAQDPSSRGAPAVAEPVVAPTATIPPEEEAAVVDALVAGRSPTVIARTWGRLLEPLADSRDEARIYGATLRVQRSAWMRMKGDFTRAIRTLRNSPVCPDRVPGILRRRARLDNRLAKADPSSVDLGRATTAFADLSAALAACAEAFGGRREVPGREGRAALELQARIQALSRHFQAMSSLSRMMHDVAMNSIQNMRS